jgi:hypothetical protein
VRVRSLGNPTPPQMRVTDSERLRQAGISPRDVSCIVAETFNQVGLL